MVLSAHASPSDWKPALCSVIDSLAVSRNTVLHPALVSRWTCASEPLPSSPQRQQHSMSFRLPRGGYPFPIPGRPFRIITIPASTHGKPSAQSVAL